MQAHHEDTIAALSTAPGIAALAVVRLTGDRAIGIVDEVFRGRKLADQPSHTAHVGHIVRDGQMIDEVVVTLFKAPRSFTREDVVEISCHGSPVVIKEILQLLLAHGARLAKAGEFTRRAFLNGRLDLAQAEAVADLIHAETANARQAAVNQMRGGFSGEIRKLREELIHFASLIELELDFGEEDVEFAGREDLRKLILKLQQHLHPLIESFDKGNVIRNGVPVVIAGKPNAGKSTLLNRLLNEERAIVSDIPGTTRDFIEDEITLGGIHFRFVDTAGLRDTSDTIEAIGVQRTKEKIIQAAVVLYLFDLSGTTIEEIAAQELELASYSQPVIRIGNKVDAASPALLRQLDGRYLLMSASRGENLQALKDRLVQLFDAEVRPSDVLVTNVRHYQALKETHAALARSLDGLDRGITGDFLAMDIRQALHYLGEITGEITTEDLLDNIFSKFCIGK
ncbi:MAG: tRNA uridine-5-carboxymethylaminomethyl(34) synthesis GTPase MnmE [Cyclobacteriaceae bacterium]|nr:tRNA uridine-5-carboxymethylaminomethyl(34) synthesis GTPase MnmE [Cyclobacteriaceae bacterium]